MIFANFSMSKLISNTENFNEKLNGFYIEKRFIDVYLQKLTNIFLKVECVAFVFGDFIKFTHTRVDDDDRQK